MKLSKEKWALRPSGLIVPKSAQPQRPLLPPAVERFKREQAEALRKHMEKSNEQS